MRNSSKLNVILGRDASGKRAARLKSNGFLTFEDLTNAALSPLTLEFEPAKIQSAFAYVQKLATERKPVYGLTTSFGGNIRHIIPPEEALQLQENLILSHATNVGEHLPYLITKAAFVLRTITLSKGYSGVSPDTVRLASNMIAKGLIPVVSEHGSLGASGDIAPLAALALAMIGKGQLWLPDGTTIAPSAVALRRYGLEPVSLSYKEGLALINGTSVMTAVAAFTLRYMKHLLENSLMVSVMSLEALRASKQPFDRRLHELKPHRYEITTASVIESILQESKMARSHAELKQSIERELQNRTETFYSSTDLQGGSYSLRAIPQIYHPILVAFEDLCTAVNTEINAIDDNPIILPAQNEELHGANFHGYPISVASDSMNLAMVGVSNMALARIDRLLKSHHSHLPWFLSSGKEGLYLGMHGIQFTAAGIGAELQNLAVPNSIVQIPTNNDNQDIVSFGLQSALKGLEMVTLLAYVIAIEYLCAGQALWLNFRGRSTFGPVSEEDMSSVTRSAYRKMLEIYEPKKDMDQLLAEPTEEIANVLLLTEMIPRELQRRLWNT